jgi:hypothetical protein
MEYSIQIINILSFIFYSSTLIFFYNSPPYQQPTIGSTCQHQNTPHPPPSPSTTPAISPPVCSLPPPRFLRRGAPASLSTAAAAELPFCNTGGCVGAARAESSWGRARPLSPIGPHWRWIRSRRRPPSSTAGTVAEGRGGSGVRWRRPPSATAGTVAEEDAGCPGSMSGLPELSSMAARMSSGLAVAGRRKWWTSAGKLSWASQPQRRNADGGGGLEGALTCSPARGSPALTCSLARGSPKRRGQRGEAGELLGDGGRMVAAASRAPSLARRRTALRRGGDVEEKSATSWRTEVGSPARGVDAQA